MFVTAVKVSYLAQDYASVCYVKTMKLMGDEYAESEDSTHDDFDESDAEYWCKMMLLLWLMAQGFVKYN